MMVIVFARNYLKHSKVNGMCVKSTPVLAPLTSPFRSFDGHYFPFSIEMGIKNRREMRTVGFSTEFRMYASFSVHENVTLLIYFFMRIISALLILKLNLSFKKPAKKIFKVNNVGMQLFF